MYNFPWGFSTGFFGVREIDGPLILKSRASNTIFPVDGFVLISQVDGVAIR